MRNERLTLVLSQGEMEALRRAAQAELRRPREQARYLVRVGLGMTDQEKHNGAVRLLADDYGAVAAVAG